MRWGGGGEWGVWVLRKGGGGEGGLVSSSSVPHHRDTSVLKKMKMKTTICAQSEFHTLFSNNCVIEEDTTDMPPLCVLIFSLLIPPELEEHSCH